MTRLAASARRLDARQTLTRHSTDHHRLHPSTSSISAIRMTPIRLPAAQQSTQGIASCSQHPPPFSALQNPSSKKPARVAEARASRLGIPQATRSGQVCQECRHAPARPPTTVGATGCRRRGRQNMREGLCGCGEQERVCLEGSLGL